jgi:hypothetical protein
MENLKQNCDDAEIWDAKSAKGIQEKIIGQKIIAIEAQQLRSPGSNWMELKFENGQSIFLSWDTGDFNAYLDASVGPTGSF